jgi:hypothetical protein
VLTQLTRNETLHQLSHCQMLKNLNKSANSRKKSKKIQKPYYLAYMCLISAKNENKKSNASVHLRYSPLMFNSVKTGIILRAS